MPVFKVYTVLLLFFICSYACQAQFSSISIYEKLWAICHPFNSIRVKKISKNCARVITEINPGNLGVKDFNSGGKQDAFRHVFYMAAFAQKINSKKIRRLGLAHEKGNYRQFLRLKQEDGERPDSLATVMDLKNNELGLTLGKAYKDESLYKLAQLAAEVIHKGEAFTLKRNKEGDYVDCNNQVIDLKLYEQKWFIPKCLVASNFNQ